MADVFLRLQTTLTAAVVLTQVFVFYSSVLVERLNTEKLVSWCAPSDHARLGGDLPLEHKLTLHITTAIMTSSLMNVEQSLEILIYLEQ